MGGIRPLKTTSEIKNLLASIPWGQINAHVHTHVCDGQKDMTVQNIGAQAEKAGLALVILTPHFHKQVADESQSLYDNSSEDIFLQLRDEITYYEKAGGPIRFLLSTEVDILSLKGDLSLTPSHLAEKALDLIHPTMNYHPLLPLKAVHLTYGKDIDGLHQRGEYALMAQEAGGISTVLEALYTTQANALIHSPYPAMLGHFFAAHSIANQAYSWFAMAKEHLAIMHAGSEKVIAACKQTGAMVDITGIHLLNETPEEKKVKDGFLYDFQRWFLHRCRDEQVPFFPGSDSHSLLGIGSSRCYQQLFALS